MQGIVLLIILCAIACVLFVDAIVRKQKEIAYLKAYHPERFDEFGRFIPYKTGRVYKPNLPINPPKFE